VICSRPQEYASLTYELSGPNAVRALKGLDLLDVVLEKANEKKPSQRLFCFVALNGSHEKIYDVSTE
jgi:hypothetical protein